jgi:hypothetical protein
MQTVHSAKSIMSDLSTGWQGKVIAAVWAAICATGAPSNAATLSPVVVDQPAHDLVYSALDNRIYASATNASTINPNALVPINATTGAVGTLVEIGVNPKELAVSSDGSTIYAVVNSNASVQVYDVASESLGILFTLRSPRNVREMRSLPSRPNAILIASFNPLRIPSSLGTQLWVDGTELPSHVGEGLGEGPEHIAIDPIDGTRGYGYQRTSSMHPQYSLTIDDNGVHENDGPTLFDVLESNATNHIELSGDHLFTNLGEIYSLSQKVKIGSFVAPGDFVLDAMTNRMFTITSENSRHTIRSYSLSTLQLLRTDTVPDVPGTASSLTRVGANGIAFKTSDQKVAIAYWNSADFDADGDVDGADFLAWQRDASVGALADWKANFGVARTASANNASTTVPEPGALRSILTAALAVVVVHRASALTFQT